MKGLRAVIRREYLQRVRSRWFLFSTFLFPVLIIAMSVVPGLSAQRSEMARRNIAVVDETGAFYERLEPRLNGIGFQVREASPGTEADLAREVRERGEYAGSW